MMGGRREMARFEVLADFATGAPFSEALYQRIKALPNEDVLRILATAGSVLVDRHPHITTAALAHTIIKEARSVKDELREAGLDT